MQRIDQRGGGLSPKSIFVALNRLIQKWRANQQNQRENQPKPALTAKVYPGFHRNTGLRAAVVSSTRLAPVGGGAPLSLWGSVSTSFAIEIMASINWSSSSFLSVSVGSIMSAP